MEDPRHGAARAGRDLVEDGLLRSVELIPAEGRETSRHVVPCDSADRFLSRVPGGRAMPAAL
jgi:hypothetical protein